MDTAQTSISGHSSGEAVTTQRQSWLAQLEEGEGGERQLPSGCYGDKESSRKYSDNIIDEHKPASTAESRLSRLNFFSFFITQL